MLQKVGDHRSMEQIKLDQSVSAFTEQLKNTLDTMGTSIVKAIADFLPDDPELVTQNPNKISIENIEEFTNQISNFLTKLNTIHDNKVHELKLSIIGNKSVEANNSEMTPLISSAFDVEKHLLCTQIREMRSKISLNCIKTNKIVVENESSEKSILNLAKNTQKLFDALLKEVNTNCILKVNELYKNNRM